MTYSRRTFLSASTASLAAPALISASGVSAATPASDKQVPGVYRRRVGDVEVTALLDGYFDVLPKLMPEFESDVVVDNLAKYGHELLDTGMRLPINGFLVNTGEKLYLIDTGAADLMGGSLGNLDENLGAAGVSADDVDTVLLTHMHIDHVGGLLNENGEARFKNAELAVSQAEWDFWWDNKNVNRGNGEAMAPLFEAARKTTDPYKDRLRLFADDAEIGDGLTSIPLPGHTPGHTGFNLSSGDEALLFWGDIIHLTGLQFARPDITLVFDIDPVQTVETRKRMLDMASSDNLFLTGAHIDFPGFGRVVREGDSYRYQHAPWSYSL